MARGATSTTSTTGRTSRSRAKAKPAAEAPTEVTTETVEVTEDPAPVADSTTEATEATPNEQAQEAPVSTDTVETVEQTDSDNTEATATTETADEAAAKQAELEKQFTEFQATVQTALAERDTSTGTLPEVQVSNVVTAYRELPGAKWKNQAKNYLNQDLLREAVNNQDIILGGAVMALADACAKAGSASKPAAERKPADPAAAYVERLATLHLAYVLASENPQGEFDVDEAKAKVEAKVSELTEQAERLYAWTHSTAEDKGDAPEVDPIVVKAVKASQGKAASAGRASGTSTPRVSDGVRRNVRTHIAQVFADQPSGTFLKVAEIAKATTEEYPDGSCSPGAITAALKSEKGVEGFVLDSENGGPQGARKL